MSPKKYGLFAIPVIAAIMIGSAIAPVYAEAAVITKDAGCVLFDGDGNLVAPPGKDVRVTTNSAAGTTKTSCMAKDVANDTGKTQKFNFDNTGIQCLADGVSTENWHAVVTRSGVSILTCHFNDNNN